MTPGILSMQAEFQYERDEHVDRLAVTRRGPERPRLRRLQRFLVESEDGVERSHEAQVTDGPILSHDRLDVDVALDLRAHRVVGVARARLPHDRRRIAAVAGAHRAAA